MALDQRKYERKHTDILRDIRPMSARVADWLRVPNHSFALFFVAALSPYFFHKTVMGLDLLFLIGLLYFWWLALQDRTIAFKMPFGSKWKDKNNEGPGRSGKGEGILYLGNVEDTDEEIWFSNSDARTHILYLGTTGAGKTEGLKSMVTNALCWGSGFVYIDGKADTDLWSSLSSLVRRFGRDDDLLVLNYMTGNSDARAPSNTMNPFSSGSASYLTNMLVSLMPDAEGDNAMWKERAVSLVGSLMPAMTWKRDNQDIPLSIGTIRNALNLDKIIQLSRDKALPDDLRVSLKSYLDTLPGYVDDAFDDEGKEKPAGPDQPQYDTTTPRQQHGYLSMQFTRALQSLGDDYGYIFDTQAADVDMVDVVLNRRILVVLIPALEKSSDEIANLGKIVAATIKGMMGSTLGATVEGESATVIENKPTASSTPFMTVFDEVGYYAAQGMAVMAAQARSLGFCLIFSAQDLPAMEKRVREEARSITANCNLKIFGKLEDPTQTKEFFEKTVGSAIVTEASGFQASGSSYFDTQQASAQIRPRASYEGLRAFKEGQAVIAFGEMVVDTKIFYSNPGHAKAMRVTRFISLPPPDATSIKHTTAITKVRDLMVHKTWTAMKADVAVETPREIKAMSETLKTVNNKKVSPIERGIMALVGVYALDNDVSAASESKKEKADSGTKAPASASASSPLTKQPEAKEKEESPSSPISPFAKKPEDEKPPEKEAPPQQTTQPAPTEKPAEDASSGGNPMSFFGAPKQEASPAGNTKDEEEQSNNSSLAPVETDDNNTEEKDTDAPLSWEDLINAADDEENEDETETPEASEPSNQEPEKQTPEKQAETKQVETKAVALDKDVEDTLKKAGDEARKALFKDSPKDDKKDDTEAAG